MLLLRTILMTRLAVVVTEMRRKRIHRRVARRIPAIASCSNVVVEVVTIVRRGGAAVRAM